MNAPDGYRVAWSYVHIGGGQSREEHEVWSPSGEWIGTFPTQEAAVEWIGLVEQGLVL